MKRKKKWFFTVTNEKNSVHGDVSGRSLKSTIDKKKNDQEFELNNVIYKCEKSFESKIMELFVHHTNIRMKRSTLKKRSDPYTSNLRF